ncbi:MAG TPA: two-component regulator propeller domain-containing protein [Verrucomicrobiae bacterium]|nr:two-component regulator propeller domain-containing protein [Verrucomicrobiae bacterium]
MSRFETAESMMRKTFSPGLSAVMALVSCCLGASSGTGAEMTLSARSEPVVRVWGTREGLPQNTVNAIVQDKAGYLWLGTLDGLARFDGVRFQVFGLADGLQSVEILSLLEDSAGTLWVGTSGGGLAKRNRGHFESVPLVFGRVGSETVTALAEDAAGSLWVGTRAGLKLIRGGEVLLPASLEAVARQRIRCLTKNASGAIWIGTDRGLFQYDRGRLNQCFGPPEQKEIVAHCLLADQSGRLWASIGNGKVLCRQEGQWHTYDQTNGLPFAYVSSMAEDASGTIWAGSLDDGLYYFEGDNFKVLRQADGLSADDIRSLRRDREGSLWVGTRTGGLNRLSQGRVVYCGPRQGLTNDFTRGVAETADGELWVGTIGGGVYRGTCNELKPFAPDPIGGFYAHIETVLAARDGSMWWAGSSALLRWQEGKPLLVVTNEPWVSFITALGQDARDTLWVGTSESHLVHFDGEKFMEFPHRVTRGAVTAFASEPDGHVWVGSVAGGLQRIQAGSDAIMKVTNGLVSQSIRTLHRDAAGDLWIGTAGGGLSCRRRGQVFSFSEARGLGARTILQIVEDDFGHLWLGTSRGIVSVRLQDLRDCADGKLGFVHTRSIGLDDGMPVEECSGGFSPAGLKTRQGQICFSTVKGLVFLDPRRQKPESPAPEALIEEVLVNGHGQDSEEANVSATGSDNESLGSRRIVIKPGARDVEVRYTAIQLSSPEKVGFRYRLQGADPDWIEAGGRRTAYYQRVPPGEYVFRLNARNADGSWNEHETTLAVVVQPFMWERPEFRAAATLAVGGCLAFIVWWVFRRRYKRRLADLQMLHAVEQERLRISQDMHDHIGGMLTQVSQLSDLGLHEQEGPAEVKQRLERIGLRARAAVQSMDEIVWATNPQNDNLASFAAYVGRCSDEFFECTSIRCWHEIPATLPAVYLRADVRHSVFLAVREAFTNVLKHSKASEVWLRLALDNGHVALEVEDNGCGFAPGQTTAHGNGLANMRARLKEEGGQAELSSNPGCGTKIRFIFPVE